MGSKEKRQGKDERKNKIVQEHSLEEGQCLKEFLLLNKQKSSVDGVPASESACEVGLW